MEIYSKNHKLCYNDFMEKSLTVESRTEHALATHDNKYVPGILYGKNVHEKIKIDIVALGDVVNKYIYNTIYKILLNNKTYMAKFNEIQRHPITNKILHFDIAILNVDKDIIVNVPVELVGSLPSNARMSVPNYTVRIKCNSMKIPQKIECNVEKIATGGKISTSDIQMSGVKFLLKQNLVEVRLKK